MCGRFTLVLKGDDLKDAFDLPANPYLSYESYNISPSQAVPVIHLNSQDQRQVSFMEWGLLPFWAKNPQENLRPINARLETLDQKAPFKVALEARRCLVPATGFYEWDKRIYPKQPYYFHLQEGEVFAFAGLWEVWRKEEKTLLSFTIITKEAELPVKPIHERMPFVLSPEHYEAWLFNKVLPDSSVFLKAYPVGLGVNNIAINDASLIEEKESPKSTLRETR